VQIKKNKKKNEIAQKKKGGKKKLRGISNNTGLIHGF
jgi:hypothetical protein